MHIGTAVRYAVFMRSESVFITCPRQLVTHGFSIGFGPRRALCSVLARERPDHNREVRLVAQGTEPAAPRPTIEVGLDAGVVARRLYRIKTLFICNTAKVTLCL
jgi:hypothetical protein